MTLKIKHISWWTFLLLCILANPNPLCAISFDNLTTENGLTDNYVNCVQQDTKGWIWIGTGMGIQRFDGIQFKHYSIQVNDTTSVKNFLVRNFFESSTGDFFGCVEDYGLFVYNRQQDVFERFQLNGEAVLTEFSVKNMVEDSRQKYWVATKNGVYHIDPHAGKLTRYGHEKGNHTTLSNNYVRVVRLEGDALLWIGTQSGLDLLNLKTGSFTHYATQSPLLNDDINDLYIDSDGTKWVATGSHGIVHVKADHSTIQSFFYQPHEARSNTVRCFFKDTQENLWFGTRGGLFVYRKEGKLEHFQNNMLEENSLVHNSIMNLTQDKKGDIWVATRGGLGHAITEKQGFQAFRAIPDNPHYLNDAEVYAIYEDAEGKVWMGTEKGGVNIYDPETRHYSYLTVENGKISNNCIKAIVGLPSGHVIIGTFQGGLNVYNPKTGTTNVFTYKPGNTSGISSNIVWDICLRGSEVWLGTGSGLDLFDPATETFTHFPEFDGMVNGVSWLATDADNDLWLGSEQVKVFRPGTGVLHTFHEKSRGLFTDSQKQTWIMTIDQGIALYNKQTGVVERYTEKEGLSSNLTYCMLEDNAGQLWISTANGLSCFHPDKKTFTNFYQDDGLPGNQFHYGAAYKNQSGALLFGGIKGYIRFRPDAIETNPYEPPVYITGIRIDNQPVSMEADQTAKDTTPIQVPYGSKVLTFDFVALNYANSAQNRYKYRLQGFDNEWKNSQNNRTATYTNLSPGTYTFQVIASNNKGVWNETGDARSFVIVPPFYKTSGFYMLAALVLLALISLSYAVILRILSTRKALEFDKKEAQRLHELEASKLRFFTNISHEIKTPLTLIISPLEKVIREDIPKKEMQTYLAMMQRNARQLMKLVTQLLDYRKLEAGQLKVEREKGDLIRFVREHLHEFDNWLQESEVTCSFSAKPEALVVEFDPDKLRKILDNLISNAIKYNKPAGKVQVSMQQINEGVELVVEDTGQGIPAAQLAHIFKRFYTGESPMNTSSGIGLSFTQELVHLLGGEIQVESEAAQWTRATVFLPFPALEPITHEGTTQQEANANEEADLSEQKPGKPILLLVEDNKDLLRFLVSHFQAHYSIQEAQTGKEGLELALSVVPDLIISDVMMPEMQGNEFCARIKNDFRTSHIPVILLTALSSKSDVLEGLTHGADDYMTKPFDLEILQTKVSNLLSTQKALREKYVQEMRLQPQRVSVQSPEEQFIQNAISTVEKHMENPDLGIELFGREMGVSRMQLYRKIAALTNMTVKEFINDIRLKRAYQLLTETTLPVSEVGYAVGFNDISYFGKCVRKKFGMSATQIIKQHRHTS